MDGQELYPMDEEEAATYLKVSPRTLQKWRQIRRGPAYVSQGRRVTYLRPDLNAWLLSQRVEMTNGS